LLNVYMARAATKAIAPQAKSQSFMMYGPERDEDFAHPPCKNNSGSGSNDLRVFYADRPICSRVCLILLR